MKDNKTNNAKKNLEIKMEDMEDNFIMPKDMWNLMFKEIMKDDKKKDK